MRSTNRLLRPRRELYFKCRPVFYASLFLAERGISICSEFLKHPVLYRDFEIAKRTVYTEVKSFCHKNIIAETYRMRRMATKFSNLEKNNF